MHTTHTDYSANIMLRNLTPLPTYLVHFSLSPVDHSPAPSGGCLLYGQAAVDDTWVCVAPGSHHPMVSGLARAPSNNTPGFFVKLKITNDEFLART